MTRLDAGTLDRLAEAVRNESFCVLRGHLDPVRLRRWNAAFGPLLEAHVRDPSDDPNRGPRRYYVTLPFAGLFADPQIVFDADILAICARVVGEEMVMCQLATDTPLMGSEPQELHRDSPGLFPEWDRETPPYQLAVNFPLVDVTAENGPTEIARGTHLMSKAQGLERIRSGTIPLEAVDMALGDVLIRDVRHLHRGTANRTDVPRPMVVVGFSRKWLRRPEVSVRVPQSTWETLTAEQRQLLRFEPVVTDAEASVVEERYRAFAY